jgi:putative endonuclease
MEYFVYIIYSKLTNKSYTGISNDINRRLNEHNQLKSSVKWTSMVQDYELVFCTQVDNRQTARLIELYLKSGIGREFKKDLIASFNND